MKAPMRMLAVSCAMLALPLCMAAQTSANMASPADMYNAMLSAEEKDVLSAADAMPADKFDYAPTSGEFKGVRTFGGQIKHLAEANYYFFGSWNVPNGRKSADIEKLTGKDDIMKAFRDSLNYEHAALSMITATNGFEQMGTEKSTRIGTATHALAHMMDHYGQMVVYLRLNGIVPPASRKGGM